MDENTFRKRLDQIPATRLFRQMKTASSRSWTRSGSKTFSFISRFKFIQTDPVSERVHPRMLKISLQDGNDLISNEEIKKMVNIYYGL